MKVKLKLVNQAVRFDAVNEQGITIPIDGSEAVGGNNEGVRPMQLLLMGLGGCSGIDICTILKKQRQKIDNLEIEIEGLREKDEIPSVFKEITICFYLSGDLVADKINKAVDLTMDKYCSVAKILEKSAVITTKTFLNGEEL